ncbi:MAG: sodium:solute symporter family protein, partial [Planctomycetales bacterium]
MPTLGCDFSPVIPILAQADFDQAAIEELGDLQSIAYLVLGGYLLLLLILGIAGWIQSQGSEEDYYLSGRNQGWLISSLTIMATFFSSFALLGAPGMVYREGVVFVLFSLNVPVAGLTVYLLGARIWKIGRAFGYVTPGDMAADYYGGTVALRLLIVLACFLFVIPYVVMQIQAGGLMSEVLFKSPGATVDDNAFNTGATMLALITTLYIMIGGMRSVAWTDVLQGILLIAGMMIGGLAMFLLYGGPAEFGETMVRKLPESSLTAPGNTGKFSWPMLFTTCLLAAAGAMTQPAQWMRFYAARSAKTLQRAAVVFTVVLTSCFVFGVMLIGLAAQERYPLRFTVTQAVELLHDDGQPMEEAVPNKIAVPGYLQDRFTFQPGDEEQSPTISWTWNGNDRVIDDDDRQAVVALSGSPSYQDAVAALLDKAGDPGESGVPSPHSRVPRWDSILVVMLKEQLPQVPAIGHLLGTVFASIIIVAIMAASMSTADSNLHALSAVATRDIYDQFIRPSAGERERVWVGRLLILAATAAALSLVLRPIDQDASADASAEAAVRDRMRQDLGGAWVEPEEEAETEVAVRPDAAGDDFLKMIVAMGFVAIAFSSQLLPIAIDMCFLRKGTGIGAAVGLGAGLFVAFIMGSLFPLAAKGIWSQLPAAEPALLGCLDFVGQAKAAIPVHESAWGLMVNVPLFAVFSLFTPKPDSAKVKAFEDALAGIKPTEPAAETSTESSPKPSSDSSADREELAGEDE